MGDTQRLMGATYYLMGATEHFMAAMQHFMDAISICIWPKINNYLHPKKGYQDFGETAMVMWQDPGRIVKKLIKNLFFPPSKGR